jgi:hypothetical protein
MFTLTSFLQSKGFDPTARKIKLIRHADSRFSVNDMIEQGVLHEYERFQGDPVFDRCSHIVSFVGETGSRCRFAGVFEVGQRTSKSRSPSPFKNEPWAVNAKYWYPTTRLVQFDEFRDRVVIDWGSGTRSWHQWYRDRPILELRAPGRFLPPFQDYLEVHLSFSQLQRLVANQNAHADWLAALTAVGAVYLIVSADGKQYVGSATGEKGLWQRWSDYARTGHGGNRELRQLCSGRQKHPAAFHFSILATFSRSLSREASIRKEQLFKKKLGSTAHGLNRN